MSKRYLKFDRAFLRDYSGTVLLILFIVGLIIFCQIYRGPIVKFGQNLLIRYHRRNIHVLFFILAAMSSTLIPLPVWIYEYTYVSFGYPYLEGAVIIGLGAGTGSFSSYILGRYFRNTSLYQRKFGNLDAGKWRKRSWASCAITLFFGSISPVPMDVFYVLSGIIHFPVLSFLICVSFGRVLRYLLMGYIFFHV